jgi:DNA-directed RNA polymerase subunit RPC12/RpoP
MTEKLSMVTCGQCGKVLDEPSNVPAEERTPCPDCGSKDRHVGKRVPDGVEVRDGIRGKARSGEAGKPGGKPWLTTMSEPSWSHARQKWMHREKTENRRDNRYTEVVKDPDTGETIHEVDEPLTDHRGHGAAQRKQDPPAE